MWLYSGDNGQEEIRQIRIVQQTSWGAAKYSPALNAAHFGDVMVHKMAGNSPHRGCAAALKRWQSQNGKWDYVSVDSLTRTKHDRREK